MIGTKLQKIFKINKQLNRSIYFRSFSTAATTTTTTTINNEPIIKSFETNKILDDNKEFNKIDFDDENKQKFNQITTKYKKKYFPRIDFYIEKEQKNTLGNYFNALKHDMGGLVAEMAHFLKFTKNKYSAKNLYQKLNGDLKRNPLITNQFLKYFREKNPENQDFFYYTKNSVSLDDWDTGTWYEVLKYEIDQIPNKKRGDRQQIENLIQEMRERKIVYTNGILEELIDYYMADGDYKIAKFYVKLLKAEPIPQAYGDIEQSHRFPYQILSRFTEILIDVDPMETINVIKALVQKNGSKMLEDSGFIEILHIFVKSNRIDEFLDIWQTVHEQSKSATIYNRVIEYFALVEGNTDFSNIFLEKLMEKHKATTESIEPILKASIKRNDNEKVIAKILKTFNVLGVKYSAGIFYWHLRVFNSERDREKIALRLLMDPEMFATIYVVVDKINDDEHNTIKKVLIDTMAQSNRVSKCLNAVIFEFLYNEDFQSALSWYSSKLQSFNMYLTYDVVYAFVYYHRIKGEIELSNHFYAKLKNLPGHEKKEEILKTFRKNFSLTNRLDGITNWLEKPSPTEIWTRSIELNGQSEKVKILKEKFHQNQKLMKFTIDELTKTLEKMLVPKNNHREIKLELEKFLESNSIPPSGTLSKILDTIYLSDPTGFLSYILSLNSQSSLLFLANCYSTIVKFDIQYGLVQMEPAFKATTSTTSLWSALVINIIRQGNPIVFKILSGLENSKRLITNQALFLLGLEIQNIRFKRNNIDFNYNENVQLDYFERNSRDNESFKYNENGKLINYYLNKMSSSDAGDLYELVKSYKLIFFSLYQKINEQTQSHSTTLNSPEETTHENRFQHYLTPIQNSSISILIDTGDFKNSITILEKLIKNHLCNRESLLLAAEAFRKSETIKSELEMSSFLRKICLLHSKTLHLTPDEIYQLSENPTVYNDSNFIREYLSVPQLNQISELRNQTLSFSVLLEMDENNKKTIENMVQTYKFI